MSEVTSIQKPTLAGRIFRFIIRFIFAVIMGVILGTVVYFGVVALYSNYTRAVQENEARLVRLETRQNRLETQTQERLDSFLKRLETLEVQSDNFKVTLGEAVGQVEAMQTMQENLEANTEDLAAAQEHLEQLQSDVASYQRSLADLKKELTALSKDAETSSAALKQLAAAQVKAEAVLSNLQTQMELAKVMETLTQSRLTLSENNLGKAGLEIAAGYQMLVNLKDELPENQALALEKLITQLEVAIKALPDRPVVAADLLSAVLQNLNAGLVEPASTDEALNTTPTTTPTPPPSP